jgi:glycosyltransferase involved in cell wall biosynthesis
MKKLFVTILIPTYKRAHLIDYVLDGLTKQTYKNFEVLVILKPSGDGTEKIVNKWSSNLRIRLIEQKQGYILDALNLGLHGAMGQIILFLDDDVIPFPNLVQNHVETYSLPNIGGVAGNVLKTSLEDKGISQFDKKPSDLVPSVSIEKLATKIGMKVWNKPLKGLEHYLFYISKAGIASMNGKVANVSNRQITKSLLGRGANMSVLTSSISDFRFPNSWILGFTFEQFLGWHLWKEGQTIVFNPELQVYHLEHGQTLSRNPKERKRETLLYTEQKLLFYRLYGIEPNLSLMHRIVWLIVEAMVNVKRICVNREVHRTARIKSIFYSETIGFKMILSKKLHSAYSPLADLKRLCKQ